MSIDGWEREELNRLHRRVEALEKQVRELDGRTGGLVRLGPQEYELDTTEIQRVADKLIYETKTYPDGVTGTGALVAIGRCACCSEDI